LFFVVCLNLREEEVNLGKDAKMRPKRAEEASEGERCTEMGG